MATNIPWYMGTAAPDSLDLGRLGRRAERRAVLLLQLGHDVGDVDELGLVEPREVHAQLDQVVTGLGLDLGRELLLLRPHVGDAVDTDLDAGVLREALGDLELLLVHRRREVVPAEVGDLALLAARRRDARG